MGRTPPSNDKIPSEEQKGVRLCFGLEREPKETGPQFKVTRERIHEIEAKALRQFRGTKPPAA